MNKLGVIYTVFNGLELLEGSIKQIKDDVDEIVIVWQSLSNRGQMDFSVYDRIKHLELDYKIHLIEFSPNLNIDTKANELEKHNQGLIALKSLGCTHFMLSATDHYYNKHEFKAAKEKCYANGIDVSLTEMYTYYKHPTWQITPREDYYMPFICRLYPETKYVKTQWKNYKVDPSVRVNTSKVMVCLPASEIIMHHYSMIREDIANKFNNAAASSRWGDKAKIYLEEWESATIDSKLAYFGGRSLVEVPNHFGVTAHK